MTDQPRSFLPAPGVRLATTFLAGAHVNMLAKALEARAFTALSLSPPSTLDGVLGWGSKASGKRAQRAAERRNVPFWSVEDGFLRSVGLGKRGMPSLSYVVDDCGVYYNAATPSRLELLLAGAQLTPEQRQRAMRFRDFVVAHGLSKYNIPQASAFTLGPRTRHRILLVDQTSGDQAIAGALATSASFREMVDAACAEHPKAEILLKTHPDTASGFSDSAVGLIEAHANIHLIHEGVEAKTLFEAVDEVWTVSSQLGFEALLHGLPVTTFGVPFYAGWGLTSDRARGEAARSALARRAATPQDVATLVHIVLLDYPVYVDPFTEQRTSAEATAERLLLWREEARRIGRDHLCVGFSRWKQPHARAYLGAGGGEQQFISAEQALAQAGPGKHIVVWGMKQSKNFADKIRATGARFSRLEDGFIRSVGLGSNFLFPWSLCLDDRGLYYDGGAPSDLEDRLTHGQWTPEQELRAEHLRQRLVALGITKYNLGGAPPENLRQSAGSRPLMLVLGQVPDDFSLSLGRALPKSNLDFLASVRRDNPAAFIVYKEHPDVVSGNRPGLTPLAQLEMCADLVLQEGDTAQWIAACDHIHVMTSLAGFEALLREKAVTCWGAPFYAGWGLVEDKVLIDRRKTNLTLRQLVSGVLIEYPLYRLRLLPVPCAVEEVLEAFERGRGALGPTYRKHGFVGRAYRIPAYVFAQISAWFGQHRAKHVPSASGAGWPFFRRPQG